MSYSLWHILWEPSRNVTPWRHAGICVCHQLLSRFMDSTWNPHSRLFSEPIPKRLTPSSFCNPEKVVTPGLKKKKNPQPLSMPQRCDESHQVNNAFTSVRVSVLLHTLTQVHSLVTLFLYSHSAFTHGLWRCAAARSTWITISDYSDRSQVTQLSPLIHLSSLPFVLTSIHFPPVRSLLPWLIISLVPHIIPGCFIPRTSRPNFGPGRANFAKG